MELTNKLPSQRDLENHTSDETEQQGSDIKGLLLAVRADPFRAHVMLSLLCRQALGRSNDRNVFYSYGCVLRCLGYYEYTAEPGQEI